MSTATYAINAVITPADRFRLRGWVEQQNTANPARQYRLLDNGNALQIHDDHYALNDTTRARIERRLTAELGKGVGLIPISEL